MSIIKRKSCCVVLIKRGENVQSNGVAVGEVVKPVAVGDKRKIEDVTPVETEKETEKESPVS